MTRLAARSAAGRRWGYAALGAVAVGGLIWGPDQVGVPPGWRLAAVLHGLAWAGVAEAGRREHPRRSPRFLALLDAAALCCLVAALLASVGLPFRGFSAMLWVAGAGAVTLALTGYPQPLPRTLARPLLIGLAACCLAGVEPRWLAALTGVTPTQVRGWLGVAAAAALICTFWWRAEHSGSDARTRLLWPALGAAAGLLIFGHVTFLADSLPIPERVMAAFLMTATLLLPSSLVVAFAAPRRFDVRRALAGLVVSVTMFDLTIGAVIGGLAALRLVTGTSLTHAGVAIVASTAAALFGPLLVRVRRATEEAIFGGAADPLEAMTQLGSELSQDSSPDAWSEALRAALVVPHVALYADGELLAEAGERGETTETTPLRAGGSHVGDLVVTLPPDVARLRPSSRAVLDLVAAPLARALEAVSLADDVRASRERVVEAREEERRRIRRDLHDGLGPVLTGVAYTADAATNLLTAQPERAGALLGQLRGDTTEAIAEVRRIVSGLRPPALDEAGLAGALRQLCVRYAGKLDVTVDCTVDAAEGPDRMPAAVEAVAYRVAAEALTNVARHARPRPHRERVRATVIIGAEAGELVVTVEDDGDPQESWDTGTGLASMANRADEVGGTVRSGPTESGGRVEAHLPCRT